MGHKPYTTAAEALCWLWDHPIFQHLEEMQSPDGTYAFRERQSLWEAGDVNLFPKIWHPGKREYMDTPEKGTRVWIKIETGPYVGRVEMLKYEEEFGGPWPASIATHDFDLDVMEPNQEKAILSLADKVWLKYGFGYDWICTMLQQHLEYGVNPTDPAWGVCSQVINFLMARWVGDAQLHLREHLDILRPYPLVVGFLYASGMLLENPFPDSTWTA